MEKGVSAHGRAINLEDCATDSDEDGDERALLKKAVNRAQLRQPVSAKHSDNFEPISTQGNELDMQVRSLNELKHLLGEREISDLKGNFITDFCILIIAVLLLSLTPKGDRSSKSDSHLIFGIKGKECGIPIREWLYIAFALRSLRSILGLTKVLLLNGEHYQAKYIFEKVHGGLFWLLFAAWITLGVYLQRRPENMCAHVGETKWLDFTMVILMFVETCLLLWQCKPQVDETTCRECEVMYSSDSNIAILPCSLKHHFHEDCLKKAYYVAKQAQCLVCQSEYTPLFDNNSRHDRNYSSSQRCNTMPDENERKRSELSAAFK